MKINIKNLLFQPLALHLATDGEGLHLSPGFVDIHVHLREPGFEYKETVRTGSMAAAAVR